MVDALNAKAGEEIFGFCVDTGKLDIARSDFYAYFYKMGARIKTLHVNDNFAMTDDRLIPLIGGHLHWSYICRAIKANSYAGDMTLAFSFAPFDPSMIGTALQMAADSARVLRGRIGED